MPNRFLSDPPLQPGDPRYVPVYGDDDPIRRIVDRLSAEKVILVRGASGSGLSTELLRLRALIEKDWPSSYRNGAEYDGPLDVQPLVEWLCAPRRVDPLSPDSGDPVRTVGLTPPLRIVADLAHCRSFREASPEHLIDLLAAVFKRFDRSAFRIACSIPAWLSRIVPREVELLRGVEGGRKPAANLLSEVAAKRFPGRQIPDQLAEGAGGSIRDFLILVQAALDGAAEPMAVLRRTMQPPTEEEPETFLTFVNRPPDNERETAMVRRFVQQGWLRPGPYARYLINPKVLAAFSSAFGLRPPEGSGYFEQFTIGPFRCFKDAQSVDFRRSGEIRHARWTVILGDNGTGKTTLLRSLTAFSHYGRDLDRGPNRAFWGQGELPICFAYGASRGLTSVSVTIDSSGPLRSLFEENSPLPDPEEWLVLADYGRLKEGGNGAQARRLDKIKELLTELLPDVSDFEVEARENGKFSVKALTPYGWVPMRDLSFGYKSAITWIVDLARRMFDTYSDKENPLHCPAVVLVDEIDLHLHPRWQRDLMTLLGKTFPAVQFIVTAHSPLIVQAAPDANIVLLRREGDRVVVENDLDHIRQWRVDQILSSELFDHQPVHTKEVQDLLDRRAELLRAPQVDREAVRAIDSQLKRVPTFAKPEDQEALDLVREAARILRERKAG